MPTKKKSYNSVRNPTNDPTGLKHVLIRDITTEVLMITPLTAILTKKRNLIRVGLEVAYQTSDRDRGRGVVFMIGSQEECAVELNVLEDVEIRNEEITDSIAIANNKNSTGSSSIASTESELVGKITNDDASMETEDVTTIADVINSNINTYDETDMEGIRTNNETSTVGVLVEPLNNDPNVSINESNNNETVTNNSEVAVVARSTISIENSNNVATCDNESYAVIGELLKENLMSMNSSSNRTSFVWNRTNNSPAAPCETTTAIGSGRRSPLNAKRSNVASDELNKKKCKIFDSNHQFSHDKLLALQEENKKLKQQIEEMKATMIPKPNQSTVDYFTTVVAICNGQNNKGGDDEEKLQRLSHAIGLSENELEQSVDPKSIRKTCRNVLRRVFKAELANSKIPYSQVLSNENIMTAIREFGRLKHPREATKFSNGELNNALGNDFYQRDRLMKRDKQKKR